MAEIYGTMEAPHEPGINRVMLMNLDKEAEIEETLASLSISLGRQPSPKRSNIESRPGDMKPGTLDFAKAIYDHLMDISVEVHEIFDMVNCD